jgi:hypothetical protein
MDEGERKLELYRQVQHSNLAPWRVRVRQKLFERTFRAILTASGFSVAPLDREPIDKFEVLVLIALVLNMVLMGLYQPLNPDSGLTQTVRYANLVLSVFFVAEATIRFIAFGIYVFTKDPWNMVDLIVIVVAVVSASLDIGGISIGSFAILRTIRVFRPLRSIVAFPSLRLLVVAMIGAVRSLSDVALMYLLFLVSFGIIGVSQFKGLLRARCVRDEYWSIKMNESNAYATTLANFTLDQFVCGGEVEQHFGVAPRLGCAPDQVCDLVTNGRLLDGFRCPYGYTCTPVANPFFGMVSFDSLPQALLTLFVSVTGELWYDACAMLMDAFDVTAAYYFFAVLILGSFFIVNLTIVLITISFESTAAFQMQKASRLLRRRFNRVNSTTSTIATHTAHLRNKRLRALSSRRHYSVSYDADALHHDESETSPQLDDEGDDTDDFDKIDAADVPQKAAELPLWSDQRESARMHDAAWEAHMTRLAALRRMHEIVQICFERDYIGHVVNALIVLNILFMSLQFYGMPAGLEQFLNISNYVFTALFCVEFVLRLLHFGPHRYFRKPVNILDFVVLVVSIIDVSSLGSQFPSIRAFRSVRLLKVLRSFPSVLRWAVVIMVSLKASFLLMVTIFIFNYVAACFGMQLFGGEFCDLADATGARPDNSVASCPNRPRANFDGIGQALLTAFQIMTGDEWERVMYNGMRAVHPLVALGFVAYFIVSSYVLVNILIGILLSGPSPAEVNSLSREIFETAVSHSGGVAARRAEQERLAALSGADDNANVDREMNDMVISADGVMFSVKAPDTTRNPTSPAPRPDEDADRAARRWRARVRRFLTHPQFETCMLWLILISCIAMAFENPLAAPDTGVATVLRNTDIAVTAVFVVEVIVNCAAFGVWRGPVSYLRRDRWNTVDFIVVLLSLIGIIGEYITGARWFRVTLSIRAIRPLRFVKRSAGLRTVFQAFVRSIVPLRSILVLALMIWTCWGLMGVQLFMGTFYSCTNSTFNNRAACLGANASWANKRLHFDHLPAAFMSLYTIASLDGWSEIMYDGIDSVAPDVAPEVNNRPAVALYFVSFVLVGAYFLVNLIVSVVIDTYNREKAKLGDKCVYLTEAQNAYVRSHRRMIRGVPQVFFDTDIVPPWRINARRLVNSREFTLASSACIVLNCVILTLVYEDAPHELNDAVFYCSAAFAAIFFAEVTCKIVAIGPRHFLESRFNRFDLMITALCVIGVLGELIFANAGFRFLFRAMRVVSLFRLMRNAGGLRHIVGRFSFALYGLGNVSALLFLCLFIYAVMGMRSFGLIKWQSYLNHQFNFTNLLSSIMVLLRALTGGDWTGFMNDCALTEPDCDPHINDCGVNVFAQIYFLTYMFVAYFILVNLFIAVILDCFVATNYTTETISKDHVTEFFDKWFTVDHRQEMRIPGRHLLPLLRSISLNNPLGIGYVPSSCVHGTSSRLSARSGYAKWTVTSNCSP